MIILMKHKCLKIWKRGVRNRKGTNRGRNETIILEGMEMVQRSKFKDPGFILAIVVLLYSAVVWIWWPHETYVAGVALTAWLMLVGIILWFTLAVVYVFWIEHVEKSVKEETERRGPHENN